MSDKLSNRYDHDYAEDVLIRIRETDQGDCYEMAKALNEAYEKGRKEALNDFQVAVLRKLDQLLEECGCEETPQQMGWVDSQGRP